MEEKQITEQQSLLLIQQMIATAKQEQQDDGRGWILWGWLLFTASVLSFLNLSLHWGISSFLFWNLFSGVAVLLLLWAIGHAIFGKKTKPVRTYTQELFQRLNVGFFISLVLIILSINIGGPQFSVPPPKGFALLLSLYGFWMLIYGAGLNFKPSIAGAYITWALAFVSLFVKSFEQTMILHAVAVLCGYIIPGYIARSEFNKKRNEA